MGRNEYGGKFKGKKAKRPNEDRNTLRFKNLGDELKRELEKTGLVEHVRVFCGSLEDRNKNPYIFFKFTKTVPPEDVQRYESDGHELKVRINNALKKNISEFEGLETICFPGGVYKEFLRVYEIVDISMDLEADIKRRSMEIILEEVRNYNFQK